MNSLLLNNNNKDLVLIAKKMTSILFPVEAQPLFGDPGSPNFILPSLTLKSLSKHTIDVLVPIIKEYCKAEYEMCIGTSSISVTWDPKDPCDMTGYSAFMSSWYRIASILADTMITRKNSVDRGSKSVKPIPVNVYHATRLREPHITNLNRTKHTGTEELPSLSMHSIFHDDTLRIKAHTKVMRENDEFYNKIMPDFVSKKYVIRCAGKICRRQEIEKYLHQYIESVSSESEIKAVMETDNIIGALYHELTHYKHEDVPFVDIMDEIILNLVRERARLLYKGRDDESE